MPCQGHPRARTPLPCTPLLHALLYHSLRHYYFTPLPLYYVLQAIRAHSSVLTSHLVTPGPTHRTVDYSAISALKEMDGKVCAPHHCCHLHTIAVAYIPLLSPTYHCCHLHTIAVAYHGCPVVPVPLLCLYCASIEH